MDKKVEGGGSNTAHFPVFMFLFLSHGSMIRPPDMRPWPDELFLFSKLFLEKKIQLGRHEWPQKILFPFWVRFSFTGLGFQFLLPCCSLGIQRSSGDAPPFQEPPKWSWMTTDKFLVLSKIKLFPLVNFQQMSSLIWKQDVAHEESEVRLPALFTYTGLGQRGRGGWDRGEWLL